MFTFSTILNIFLVLHDTDRERNPLYINNTIGDNKNETFIWR